MSGTYPVGHRMAVDELARQLGVSTMPVREALVALASEGLLEVLPRRGFRVARIGRQDFEDIFQVHSVVAGMLAERAATSIDGAGIQELRELQARIEALPRQRISHPERASRVEELNFEFHRTVNRSTESERLRWFLRATTRFVPRQFYEAIPGWMDVTVTEHPAIIDALERREGPRVRELMSAHVAHAGNLVVSELTRKGFWDAATADGRG
jgi:DNA-binding GntR family transcriptional regulator